MAIRFLCACGEHLTAPETRAGQRIKCHGCGKALVVPAPADPTVVEERPPAGAGAEAGSLDAVRQRLGGRPAAADALGHHEILEELGAGGMGKVLLVRDPELNRKLAAKVILGGATNAPVVQKFLVEAQVTGQLEHPNIAPVHELGISPDGQVYFTMKRVRGKDLATMIAELRESSPGKSSPSSRRPRARPSSKDGRSSRSTAPAEPHSLRELLQVFVKVCDAIAFAHSRGVIHRDLKPANVMAGEFGEVLVMDWGLANIAGHPDPALPAVTPDFTRGEVAARVLAPGAPTLRTLAGSLMGTPAYMPPEQAKGEVDRLTTRSDIYSLGAILYEMLALEPPFTGKTPSIVIEKVTKDDLVPPSRRAPEREIPRELEAAVMKAMAYEPDDRYPRVEDLKRDIEAYLSGHTLAAAQYSPWQLLAKWAGRNKVAVTGGVATTVALLAGLLGIVFVAGRAEAEKLREAERARLEEKDRSDNARAEDAEDRYAQGRAAWAEAERTPFNPAAPQDYFRPHVAALSKMGRALQGHPCPPADWAGEVADWALEAQTNAETVGDWGMAQVLAESALGWGAVDEAEAGRRLARVEEARTSAAREDEATLRDILGRIAKAEGAREKGGTLLPGEVPERARRLALHGRPELTQHVIARLTDEKDAPRGAARDFLIEFLGRKGDVHAEHEGVTAPELVLAALEEAREPERIPASEVAAWLWAAARLEARAPGSFGDLPGRADALALAYEGLAVVTLAAEAALGYLAAIRDKAPLPPEAANQVDFERRTQELADLAAARIRSGNDHTKLLLDLTEDTALSARQLAFVYGQLGLLGRNDPPDPARPESTAVAALRTAFERDLPPLVEAAMERKAPPEDSVTLAVAAADGLSRLGDTGFASVLSHGRMRAGEFSVFARRTAVALALLPPVSTEPRTAAGYVERGLARKAQGDLAGATQDYARAIEIEPNHAAAYNNRGNALKAQGDLAGAIQDYTRALEIDPNFALAHYNRGNARQADRDLAGAIRDYDRALEIDANLWQAWATRAIALSTLGRREEAARSFDEALARCPPGARAQVEAARRKSLGQ